MNSARKQLLLREAAEWFVRVQEESVTTEELNDWQHWLAQSSEHRQAFQDTEDFWQDTGRIKNPPWPSIQELSEDGSDRNVSIIPVVSERRGARFPVSIAAAITALTIAGGIFFWSSRSHVPSIGDSANLKTAHAENREFALSDGSHITVGAKSQVEVQLTQTTRTVALDEGEAFFKVAQDRTRPFVVHAAGGSITAIGTQFNVRYQQEKVVVTVVDGAVAVSNSGAAVRYLKSGQQLAYDRLTTAEVRTVDPGIATAWRSGRLKYLNEPLEFVIGDVVRHTREQIEIADPAVNELLFTGTVLPEEVDDWLTSVSQVLPVDVIRDGNGRVLLKSRSAQPK